MFDELDDSWDSTEPNLDGEVEDDVAEVVDCPACRRPIYEASERCPHCGTWVCPSVQRPGSWTIAVAVLVIIALLTVVFLR